MQVGVNTAKTLQLGDKKMNNDVCQDIMKATWVCMIILFILFIAIIELG